ncbi:MAG: hypothetical protein HY718_15825 [Planctomycetes bacterium]|nr:hypothetical protein [Planctomycetota bacterium]
MTEPYKPGEIGTDVLDRAYQQGRRAGLATAALAMSIVAFISLLGVEKAVLAAVLAVVSLRGLSPGTRGRRLGLAALVIVGLYAVTFIVVVVAFHEKFARLFHLLQQLG